MLKSRKIQKAIAEEKSLFEWKMIITREELKRFKIVKKKKTAPGKLFEKQNTELMNIFTYSRERKASISLPRTGIGKLEI